MKRIFTTFCLALGLVTATATTATAAPTTARELAVQSKAKAGNSARKTLRPLVNSVQLPGLNALYPAPVAFTGRIAGNSMRPSRDAVRPPMRTGSTGSTIYGWLTNYYDPYGEYKKVGLNEISLDGTYTTKFNRNDATAGGGFIRDGRVCVFSLEAIGGEILGAFYREFDMETNELVLQREIDTSLGMNNIFVTFAYDDTSDMIYGYAYNQEGSSYTFSCSPGYDPTSLTVIKELGSPDAADSSYAETCTSLTYNPSTGKLVGVNLDKNLVEIGTDGSQKVIMSVKSANAFADASGLCYSPIDAKYVWNCSDVDRNAYLYAIDPEAKTLTKLYDYTLGEVFAFFVTTDGVQDKLAPQAPVLVSDSFTGTPSLSGSFTVMLPSTLTGGSAIGGNVTLSAMVDGVTQTATAAPGNEKQVQFGPLDEGMHSFIFSAEVNGHVSAPVRKTMFIGYDWPCQPAEVTVTDEGISWTAVTAGANGGYMNPAEVTYDILLDGVTLATDVKGTTCAHTFGTDVDSHIAEVCAKFHGKESGFTSSGKFISGGAMQLPVHIGPNEAQASLLTVVDANRDNQSWVWTHDAYGEEWLSYEYSATENADDWVILPAIRFPDAGKRYELTFDAHNDLYDERMEVCMGKLQAVSAMNLTIVPPLDITNRDNKTFKYVFDVPEAGDYYLGFHAISPANANRLTLMNINVSESNVSQKGPEAVASLTATETAPGELSAKVTFAMPRKLITGQAIDAEATLTATVTSPAATVTVSGKPGATVSATVATLQSDNLIVVQPALGSDYGMKAEVNVYTGVDLPGRVRNLAATTTDDNLTIHLTWNAPAEGANGGFISATGITYKLMGVVPGPIGNVMGVIDEIGTDVFEYDYKLPAGSLQQEVILGVTAQNAAGIAPRYVRISTAAGKPYDMPVTETFDNYAANYSPILFPEPSEEYEETVWGITNPAILSEQLATDNGSGLICNSGTAPSRGRACLPKISTMGATNTVISFDYAGGVSDLEVYAEANGRERTRVGRLSDYGYDGKGYQHYSMPLPAEFNNLPWVQLSFEAIFSVRNGFAISNYDVRDYVAYDLGITGISIPTSAALGEEAEFRARITNFGYEAATMPAMKWAVNRGGKTIAEFAVAADATVTIEPGKSVGVSYRFVPTAEMAGDVEAVLTLEADDANSFNNTVSQGFSVNRGESLTVTDLSAENSDGGVVLTWTQPVSDRVTCSFEDEEPYEPNMPTLGGFKNIDGDGQEVYGYSSWDCPNAYEPCAFTAWSAMGINAIIGEEGVYSASDGDMFLITFCPSVPNFNIAPADDWLISPEIAGGSEVTLDLRSIRYAYGTEIVEIMASSTTDDPKAFTLVKTINLAGNPSEITQWETHSAVLPADARYFAIHYVSRDVFGVQLDNIRYVAATAVSPVTGYDIYRDGVLIAENVKSEGTYVDATAAKGPVYTYHIIPVIDGTRGEQSNTATVDTSGIDAATGATRSITTSDGVITVTGYAGEAVTVYTADGITAASLTDAGATARIPLREGVYLVKAGTDVAKVVVR